MPMHLEHFLNIFCLLIVNTTSFNVGITTISLLSPQHVKNNSNKSKHNKNNMILNSSSSSISSNEKEESSSTAIIKSTINSENAGKPICDYHEVTIKSSELNEKPRQAIKAEDMTPIIKSLFKTSDMKNGVINIISRHATTAITINERESRLAKDMENYFLSLAPPDERSLSSKKQNGMRHKHNDINKRPESEEEAQRCRENGWDIDDPASLQEWRHQEPINAHSHILSMLLGSSESVPVVDGQMVIGQWQSVLLVDLDGPRHRTVGMQFLGYQ